MPYGIISHRDRNTPQIIGASMAQTIENSIRLYRRPRKKAKNPAHIPPIVVIESSLNGCILDLVFRLPKFLIFFVLDRMVEKLDSIGFAVLICWKWLVENHRMSAIPPRLSSDSSLLWDICLRRNRLKIYSWLFDLYPPDSRLNPPVLVIAISAHQPSSFCIP